MVVVLRNFFAGTDLGGSIRSDPQNPSPVEVLIFRRKAWLLTGVQVRLVIFGVDPNLGVMTDLRFFPIALIGLTRVSSGCFRLVRKVFGRFSASLSITGSSSDSSGVEGGLAYHLDKHKQRYEMSIAYYVIGWIWSAKLKRELAQRKPTLSLTFLGGFRPFQ